MLFCRVAFLRNVRKRGAFSAVKCRFREPTSVLENDARLRNRAEPTVKDERDPYKFS
jgi:hypothetical protein